MWKRIVRWWYFNVNNPVIRKGEHGGFKWCFRRFWLDIETVSGNFKARFTADEHPYGYLISGNDEDNIIGFCQTIYTLGKTLTTDQGLVNDISKSIQKYIKRIEKSSKVEENEPEDNLSLASVMEEQEVSEMSKKEQRKYARRANKSFNKAVKEADKNEGAV